MSNKTLKKRYLTSFVLFLFIILSIFGIAQVNTQNIDNSNKTRLGLSPKLSAIYSPDGKGYKQ
ncbi:MAG: hypothetical protein ACFFCE_10120 [Promethearchaeota archaeon]